MGYNQSKPQQNNVAIAQTVSNEMIGQKVSSLEIIVIVFAVFLGILTIWFVRNQCKKRVRNWFQKEAVVAGWSPPMVKVQTVQPPTVPRNPEAY